MNPTVALPGSMTRMAIRLNSGSRCRQSPKGLPPLIQRARRWIAILLRLLVFFFFLFLFVLRLFHRGLEVADAFAHSFSQRGKFAGAEDQEDDPNEHNQMQRLKKTLTHNPSAGFQAS